MLFSAGILLGSFALFRSQTLEWKGFKEVRYGNWGNFRYPECQLETRIDGGKVFVEVTSLDRPILRWETVDDKNLGDMDPSAISGREVLFPVSEGKWRIEAFKVNSKGKIERLSEILPSSANLMILSEQKNEAGRLHQIGTIENPLVQGTFYKIRIPSTGIYRLGVAQLRAAGIPVDQVDPRDLRIYGNGGTMLPENPADSRYTALQENAIEVIGEQDGRWNDGDMAIFYAQGPHGFNVFKNSRGSGNGYTEYRDDSSANLINIYEDAAYYYINFDKGRGKRVQPQQSLNQSPQKIFQTYDEYQYLNEEKINLAATGRIWVGDAIAQPRKLNFNTLEDIPINSEIRLRTRVAAARSAGNSLILNINNKQERIFNFYANSATAQFHTHSVSISSEGGRSLSLEYVPNLSNNPLGSIFFDYAEIQYQQPLTYSGGTRFYRNYGVKEGKGGVYEFQLSSSVTPQRIWNITDRANIETPELRTEGNKFSWKYQANSNFFNNEFVAFSLDNLPEPQFIGRVENQDLHSLQDIDYLIISDPQLQSQARRLLDYHQKNSGFSTAMVSPQEIYNEFSSGSQDISAIRDFILFLNEKSTRKVQYVLIVGDTSYDYRNRLKKNAIVVPAYQSEFSSDAKTSFVSDDFFVTLSPYRYGSYYYNLPDLPIGRLIAGSVQEARLLVDKTLAYYHDSLTGKNSFGDWQMRFSFAVDDDDTNDGAGGGTPFDVLMEKTLRDKFEAGEELKEYHIKKIYADAFQSISTSGGQRYPIVNQLIENSFSSSNFLMYFGHGGVNGWAQERIFTKEEGDRLNNFNRLFQRFPVVSTVTCDFTTWDDPGQSSLGEEVIKNPRGGSALMLASSRAIGIMYGVNYSDAFIKDVFSLVNENEFGTIGQASLRAKIQMGLYLDHQKVNLLGDPAMRISRPARQIQIESVTPPNQLRALDFVVVKGFVKKQDGTKDTEFNGNMSLNLFDKKIRRRTLNNDGNQGVMEYQEEKDPMVKTATKVINGDFVAEFYLPKDIDFSIGEGRMLLYAENGQKDVFQNQSLNIGGVNPNGIQDNHPPRVSLFMNNTSFVNGGITDSNPTLLACLTDETGINSTGTGLGHDITVQLDDKVIDTRILNEFYTAGEGNSCINPNMKEYQKGSVAYPLRGMSPGKHKLTFKVWDINNNSATASLDFIVRDQRIEGLQMDKLMNWPNPFTDRTYIQFEHNCDAPLDTLVQIYSVTGRLVRSIRSLVSSAPYMDGYRTDRTAIEWDGKDDFGDTVGKGTYIYKVKIQGQDANRCKGTAEGVEKLVILK